MITHTEIIARAIRQLDSEIEDWRDKCKGLPEDIFNQATWELVSKRDDLLTLYLLETGTTYE